MGYQRPCDAPISATNAHPLIGTWRGHREGLGRPRSQEAGVDYACVKGTPLLAPADGTVREFKDTNSGATGRFLTLDLDDGRRVRWLHLKPQQFPAPGTRFRRGQVLARSGGSANGRDDGVGSHVHVTLWPGHFYAFGLDANTLDFDAHVDGGAPAPALAGSQRVVGPNGANGRRDPSTANPVAQTLSPGTVANLDGWITGQNVQGRAVWFHGAISGNWFWSGGFTDTGTHDLPALNPVQIGPRQRKVGVNGSNGRGDPSTNGPVLQTLAPGTIGDFNGWLRGQAVQGNDVWFRGAHSGNWFWSGGFTTSDTHDLADLNPAAPAVPAPAVLEAAALDNPRGLSEYAPVYVRAVKGLDAPLGFRDDGSDALRTSKGLNPPVPVTPVIDRYIIHHTGTTADQLDFFSHKNDRLSCPTWYLRADGSVIEMIRPRRKPAATGSEWNWRSVATETLNSSGAPEWKITDAQKETHAQIIAWLAGFDGAELDGVPVSFRIDQEHVITHQETGAQTECPGPDLQGAVDGIVARAREVFDAQHPDH